MAGLVRATQSYWAGNRYVRENTVMHEGHPDVVELYVEAFVTPEPHPVEVKRGPGRPRKNGE